MTLLSRLSRHRTSLQYKLFIIFSLLTFLIASLLSSLYIISETRQARRHSDELLQIRTEQLADSIRLSLYAEDGVQLRRLAEEAATLIPETRSVTIRTSDGRVLTDLRPKSTLSASADRFSRTAEVRSNLFINSIDSEISGNNTSISTLIGTVSVEQGTTTLSQSILQRFLQNVFPSV